MTAHHTLKLVVERGGEVRFIRAVEEGTPCWFYMRIDPVKLREYEAGIDNGTLNIRDYGQILQSGWGAYPPEDIAAYMLEKHEVDVPELDDESEENV